jgi:hypothetical protein
MLPYVAGGTDFQALIQAALPFIDAQLSSLKEGRNSPRYISEAERDAINAVLAKLPGKPDETLK